MKVLAFNQPTSIELASTVPEDEHVTYCYDDIFGSLDTPTYTTRLANKNSISAPFYPF